MTPALAPKRELWLLLTLAGIQFTHVVDFMIMMPLGPQFTRLFSISDAQFGLLVSAYTFSAGLSGLVATLYVDRFGRKRLLLVLYVLFGLATLSCGLAGSYGSLMAARVAAGCFGGVLSALSQTIVADVIPFERRGRAMGIVMSSFSAATVAGVPLSLFLAAHWDWHMPFFMLAALCAVLALTAAWSMPVLTDHLQQAGRVSTWAGISSVLADRNHHKAFAFSSLLMFAGFTTIPYITIYMTSNAGLSTQQVPYIYLCGGAATLLTARWFGRMTDRLGKVQTFRLLAALVGIPIVAVTVVAGAPLWGVLLTTTTMFLLMSGRMIPGMAIIGAAGNPRLRGTFMTINSSVQSASMGLAAFLGGHIIGRDPQGLVVNYWVTALVGVVACALAWPLAGRLNLYGSQPPGGAAVPSRP
jgi:predicted MFS family arabinose efflux permease